MNEWAPKDVDPRHDWLSASTLATLRERIRCDISVEKGQLGKTCNVPDPLDCAVFIEAPGGSHMFFSVRVLIAALVDEVYAARDGQHPAPEAKPRKRSRKAAIQS